MAGFELGDTLAAALGSVPAPGSVRTPGVIGEEIRSLTSMANYTTVWFAVEIGRRLTEAKELVGHGGWMDFLETETQFSASTAQNLMRVYREYGAKQNSMFGAELANSQTFGNLSYTKALALLAIEDEDERADFVMEHDVESMSTRELKDAIRERDEARAALDEERKAAEGAALRISDLEAQMAELRRGSVEMSRKAQASAEALEQAKHDLENAQAEAETLRGDIKELENRPREVAVQVDEEAVARVRAEMQKKLEKAEKAAKDAEKKRKLAEGERARIDKQLDEVRAKLAAAEQANARSGAETVIAGDAELTKFELLYSQAVETVNAMHGLLLKVAGREDSGPAENMRKALAALSDAVKGCVE